MTKRKSARTAAVSIFAVAVAVASLATTSSAAADPSDLVITAGGTYSGTYTSIDVQTSAPVVLSNVTVEGPGHLIQNSTGTQVSLSIVNSTLVGSGSDIGRAITLKYPASVVIDSNYLENVGGIYILGPGTGNTIHVTNNRAKNIYNESGGGRVQFLQFDKVQHVSDALVQFNLIENTWGESAVEDVISMYESSGLSAAAPILIDQNQIFGAYPRDATATSYTGGGIMAGDGPTQASGFIHATNNLVVGTSNYGLAISSGHDIVLDGNVVIEDGNSASNVGIYVWNFRDATSGFENNSATNNESCWIRDDGQRNNFWLPDAASSSGNISYTGDCVEPTAPTTWP